MAFDIRDITRTLFYTKDWGGKSYNENWEEIDAMGNTIGGGKDWGANASYAAATNTQNPFTNQAGSSPWDKSGLIPGNEPGSTLPRVSGVPTGDVNTIQGATSSLAPGFGGQVQSKLLADLNLDPTVNQQDPAYRQQVDSFNYGAKRNADRQRAATAQRMYAQGTLTGGGLDSAVERIGSEQGASEQAFEGQLLGKFRDQNLDRTARALSLGTGLLSQEQEQALRGALTREGYGLQRELGLGDLNFRRDALGQQGAFQKAQMDQQALLALLGYK